MVHFAIAFALGLVLMFGGLTLAKALGVPVARMLLAIVGVLRYRQRWLEACETLTLAGEENAELRRHVDDCKTLTDRAVIAAERAVERNRELVSELQETIAELCVEVAVLEGRRDAELVARSEELARIATDRRAKLLTAEAERAERAWRQANPARGGYC